MKRFRDGDMQERASHYARRLFRWRAGDARKLKRRNNKRERRASDALTRQAWEDGGWK